MFESLTELVSGSPWTYAVILAIAALDALFPLVPSETTAIAAGVLAGAGELSLALVIAAAAAGAFAGDSSSYAVGRTLGERVTGRVFRGDKGRARREWAARALERRGAYVIVVARFVPGGRTAATLTAGALGMPPPRFLRLAALAAAVWASYASLLGYVGGRAFQEHPWQGLLLALALAAAVGAAIELVRRLRRGRPEGHAQAPVRHAPCAAGR